MTARIELAALISPPDVADALCADPVVAGATVRERWALFFADPRTLVGRREVERAKAICETCDGQLACAEFALVTRQPYGTWGAMGEVERRRLFRLNRRFKRPVRRPPRAAA